MLFRRWYCCKCRCDRWTLLALQADVEAGGFITHEWHATVQTMRSTARQNDTLFMGLEDGTVMAIDKGFQLHKPI
jgi:hypothetical protein